LSGEEDFRRVDDALKLIELNLRRIIGKYQHLLQSIQYLGDDIAILQNNLDVVSTLLSKLKSTVAKENSEKSGSKQN
jgi:prefoldin subunit 5